MVDNSAAKHFHINTALCFCCLLANTFLKYFVHARQEYLAQLWGMTSDKVVNIRYLLTVILLLSAVYFTLRAWHYSKAISAISQEEREEQERRKREYEEEDAKAQEWLNSSNS